MSKDTIYREDAIKAINARSNWYQVTCNGKQIAVMLMAKDVNEILEKLPSADRPQGGEWIVSDDKYFHTCQFCNADVDVSLGTGIFVNNDEVSHMNYCPNCGARIKGADDE